MLTRKQRDLLVYIQGRLAAEDVAPSFEEMKEALGLKSKSGIHRLIGALEERGYIQRLPHRARALEILRLPETLSARREPPESARTTRGAVNDSAFAQVPLCGKIAAGTPIEALSQEGDSVSVPPDMLGPGEHYALTIEGDSMTGAGICDGDMVIIKRCDTAENGAIIVALVDDQEATLKRLRRAGAKIVLEPENPAYEPQILDPGRVKIQGRLTGLIRTYH
ncbi:MAG: transcriptional repressor LexA [Alphaproteobacteria bacterium]|nr:transcriptional repressor LexA [Alphaproteobacteria bacterium]